MKEIAKKSLKSSELVLRLLDSLDYVPFWATPNIEIDRLSKARFDLPLCKSQ